MKRILRSKKFRIAVVAVVILLIGGAGGAYWHIARAKSEFTIQWNAYRQQSVAIIETLQSQSAELKNNSKAADAVSSMRQAEAQLEQQLRKLPASPLLLGYQLEDAAWQQSRQKLKASLEGLRVQLKDAATFLEYEQAITGLLIPLTQGSGSNATEQRQLASHWQKVADDLAKYTPPGALVAQHARLVTAVSAAQATLATLPNLYDKKDITGFAAKKQELAAKLVKIQEVHADYAAHALQIDSTLHASFAAAAQAAQK